MYFKTEIIIPETIVHLGTYHPYWLDKSLRIKNSKFDSFSSAILDFKQNNQKLIAELHRHLSKILSTNFCICMVPSHIQSKTNDNTPLSILSKKLVKSNNLIDGTNCLIRTNTINKLSNGGCRDINIHLDSIIVQNPEIIKDNNILVIDDITTTGNSLYACKQKLLEAGAKNVVMLAIAKTANDKINE